jgi:DNA-binding NarL/FixJ family response regulator
MSQTNLQPIRILLADDQKLVRHGLHTVLSQQPGMEVVGEADSPADTLSTIRTVNPSIVLLEIAIAGNLGVEFLIRIMRHHPAPRVLILTSVEDDETVLGSLQAEVSGYLLKSISPVELVQSIHCTMQDGSPLHPRIARLVLRCLHTPVEEPTQQPSLTTRERETLRLLAQGCSNSEIAKELYITEFTVRTHVCNVLRKLNLENRTQAALYVVREQQKHRGHYIPTSYSHP